MVTHIAHHKATRRVFRAIADPTRRRILERLRSSNLTAGQIAESFSVSRPAISRHLRVLRGASLVQADHRGRERVYALNAAPLADIEQWAAGFRLALAASMIRLKEHVESTYRKGDRP